MKKKKPHYAVPSDVTITRNGEYAIIEYEDKTICSVHLKVGQKINNMTDMDILELHNSIIISIENLRRTRKYKPVEIPEGRPQIRYNNLSGQWVPRGDVLRCTIEDGGPSFETTVCIDDKELSIQEFAKLLSVYTGWGMRIVFVDSDEIHKNHETEVKDPKEEDR